MAGLDRVIRVKRMCNPTFRIYQDLTILRLALIRIPKVHGGLSWQVQLSREGPRWATRDGWDLRDLCELLSQFTQGGGDGEARRADGWKEAADKTNQSRPNNSLNEQLGGDRKRKRDLAEALPVHGGC